MYYLFHAEVGKRKLYEGKCNMTAWSLGFTTVPLDKMPTVTM